MTAFNWLDRTIEFMAPGWAVRRAHARGVMDISRSMGYRGSVASRIGTAFDRQPQITGQRLRDRIALGSMRDRSRMVDENNPIGQGMLNRIVDNVVGEGFVLQGRTKSKEFNAEVEERWRDWFNVADIRNLLPGVELQRQLVRAHERDGDTGLILVDQSGKSRLQMIEADQIRTPDGATESPTMNTGVEMNRVGRPIRYHILDSPEFGVRKFRPIPADYFVYYPRFKRFNAIRGEPAFSTCFTLLDQVDGYIDAVVIAARMAAIFGLIMREQTGPQQLARLRTLPNANGESQRAITLENGMVKYVGNKDDIIQVQAQQPMQQTPDFIAAILRLIGLPLDMPLELVLLDFSRVNYSSARASFLQFYQAMRPKQEYFREKVLSRIYRWWISRAVAAGEFSNPVPDDYWSHHFMARGWQWVDPLKDVQAALLEISMGINTPRRVAARLGRDYEELSEELAADLATNRLLNLPWVLSSYTRDPMTPAAPGSTIADPTQDKSNDN